jgi:hypothetical protein
MLQCVQLGGNYFVVCLVSLGSAHTSGLSCLSGILGDKENLYLEAELGTPVYYSAAHFEEMKGYLSEEQKNAGASSQHSAT